MQSIDVSVRAVKTYKRERARPKSEERESLITLMSNQSL